MTVVAPLVPPHLACVARHHASSVGSDRLLTVRINSQTRAWFSGPWRLGERAWSAGFGVRRRG